MTPASEIEDLQEHLYRIEETLERIEQTLTKGKH